MGGAGLRIGGLPGIIREMTGPRAGIRPRSIASSWRRAALIGAGHGAGAVVVTAGCYGLLAGLRRRGQDGVGTILLQASGITALLWAYAGLVLGLVVSISSPARRGNGRRMAWRPAVLGWHRQLNVTVVALTLLHALSYAIGVPGGSLLVALVPWTADFDGLGYTLGVLALYLAVVLGPTYYLRRRIGRRIWLVAHQLAAVSYALGLWHAMYLGSDLRLEGVGRVLVWVLQIPLLALIGLRLRRPLRLADQLSSVRRAGRFEETRHVLLRLAVAIGLSVTAAIVLVMALLAVSRGQHGTLR